MSLHLPRPAVPLDEAGGSPYPRDVHPRTRLRVRLNQAVNVDDVELPELVIVGVLVLHRAIEQDESTVSVDHTRYVLASVDTIRNDGEPLRWRVVVF